MTNLNISSAALLPAVDDATGLTKECLDAESTPCKESQSLPSGLPDVPLCQLPTELKVMILKYVVDDVADEYTWWSESYVKKFVETKGTAEDNKLAILFLPPRYGLSNIAREIIFSKCWSIFDLWDNTSSPAIKLPPWDECKVTKNIAIYMCPRMPDFMLLQGIVDGSLGFDTFVEVKIILYEDDDFCYDRNEDKEGFIKALNSCVLTFKVTKQLIVWSWIDERERGEGPSASYAALLQSARITSPSLETGKIAISSTTRGFGYSTVIHY